VPRKALNSAAWAAGGMYSTAGEMAQWYRALMTGEVIEPESLNEMTTFVGSENYGIGISEAIVAGRNVWLHGGAIWGGYNSTMMYDPLSGAVIAVLINQLPAQAFVVARQLLENLINHTSTGNYMKNNSGQLNIYPNPAADFVRIELPKHTIESITVYDSLGQFIQEEKASEFSVLNWSTGIYKVQVQTVHGIYQTKLMKH
jgi:hypothetical protein